MARIKKKELIQAIQKKIDGISKKDIKRVIKAYTDTVYEFVKNGDKVVWTGFGIFARVNNRKNPKEKIMVYSPCDSLIKFLN